MFGLAPNSTLRELDESERFLEHPGKFLRGVYGRGWADGDGSLMSARAWSEALGRREAGPPTRRSAVNFCFFSRSNAPNNSMTYDTRSIRR